MKIDLEGKTITIVGASRSGMAVAKLVAHQKGIVRISELCARDVLEPDFKGWIDQRKIDCEFDGHTKDFIVQSDLVVLSPGVRIDADSVRWAREAQIPVVGEVELAYQFCPKPIIAVTGSNGKTTTSTLILRILEAAGKKSCLCGNVGTPFALHVLDLQDFDYVVLEISSFQLETIKDFKPFISVFLNFSENHLDRHKDMSEYLEAKSRIFENQSEEDFAVLNYADPKVRGFEKIVKARARFFNKESGLNPNYSAALEVARIIGIEESVIQRVWNSFKGIEHRLEHVRSLEGVDYINDSKSTTVEAGRWALSNISQPLLMICGGRDKNVDFEILRSLVGDRVKKMFVIGEASQKIKKAYEDVVGVEKCSDLRDAVMKSREHSSAGDCVLLSPMCASFDMFVNYEERGRIFKEIVNELS